MRTTLSLDKKLVSSRKTVANFNIFKILFIICIWYIYIYIYIYKFIYKHNFSVQAYEEN